MGLLEKINDIEKEIGRTQKNKATEYHLGLLRSKLAKYREQLLQGGGENSGEHRGSAKNRGPKTLRNDIPMGSSGAQRLLELDLLENPSTVQSTTEALIDEGYLPTRQLLDDGFLDDDIYDCLVRMDKKDSATKLKGLSDFMQLLTSKTSDKLLNTRTFWARLFVSFLDDEDPRVREVACRCQEQYVAVLKKDIVPILKRVIGPWWLAQYQMHSAAASAARSSFAASFSEQKRPDVLRLGSQEIFQLLRRKIVPQASLRDKLAKPKASKGQPPEASGAAELSDDQQQRIAEALVAFSGFVYGVHPDGLNDMQESFTSLLDHANFWKLSRLQNPRVREHLFTFLRALWEKSEGWMSAFVKDSFSALIGNLHERDLRAATTTWDVLLLVISKNPNWSSVVDTQKIVVPKLLALLRHGGFGAAGVVYPSLIVLIDNLPEKSQEMYDIILGALIQGFAVENMRISDIQAICRAVGDCFNYIRKKADGSIAEAMVEKHLVSLMEDSLLSTSSVIKGVGILQKLLVTWMTKDGNDNGPIFSGLVFKRLADKVRHVSPADVGTARVQQWLVSFSEAAWSVPPVDVSIVNTLINKNSDFQEFMYQIIRLAFLVFRDSKDPEQGKTLLIIFGNIYSPTLLQRLKEFIEEPVTQFSSYYAILNALPPLTNHSIHLQIFCVLLRHHTDQEKQEMFSRTWDNFPQKICLLQAIDRYCGVNFLEGIVSSQQAEELVLLSEKLVAGKNFANVGILLEFLHRVNKEKINEVEERLLRKAGSFSPKVKLQLLHLLLSLEKPDSLVATTPKIIYDAILCALQLAKESQDVSEEDLKLVREVGAFVANKAINFESSAIVPTIRAFFHSSVGRTGIENLISVITNIFSQKDQVEQLCLCAVDFATETSNILSHRTDVFLVRINTLIVPEDLKLEHMFWDEVVERVALACFFISKLFTDFQIVIPDDRSQSFYNCFLAISAYIELAFDSGVPVVHDHELLQELELHRTDFQTFIRSLSFSVKHRNEEPFASVQILSGVLSSAEVENTITAKNPEELSQSELIHAYSALWSISSENISEAGRAYRNQVRDRLETLLAFVDFPRSCAVIKETPWSVIQLVRMAPSILSERCVDADYSGAVLDVFGTVVIDWISCLQDPAVLEEDPKVVVLIEEAVESVGNILKATAVLKDAGILWVELTEFSFPRILAALLDGLFRFAEASEDYLTQRYPVTAKLIAGVCGVIHDFVAGSQDALKPVWDTLFHLEFGMPEKLTSLHTNPTQMTSAFIQLFSPLLLHKVANFQLVAGDIIAHLPSSFPPAYHPEPVATSSSAGAANDDPEVPAEEEQQLAPPVELLSVIDEAGDIVETILQDVSFGNSVGGVVPRTDSYTYILGYLMAWRSTFAWIRAESSEAKQAFAKYLETSGSFGALMDNLVRLVPIDVVQGNTNNMDLMAHLENKFSSDYVTKFVGNLTDIEDWAHLVYAAALQALPMLARSWFGRKQGPILKLIGTYTSRFISQNIITQELLTASEQAKHVAFDNFKIHVRPTVAEITAEYRVEVWVAEIVVKIPKDYPLGMVQVFWGNTTKGNAMDAWNSWVVRLSGFLRRQNMSILDGILDWKKSVDKKFRGVEACAICLSVVDTKTTAVPKMQCKTCKNKFHTECLYRWFAQQVDPTCPLCREKFFA